MTAKVSSRYLGLLDRLQDAHRVLQGIVMSSLELESQVQVIHNWVFLRHLRFLNNNYNYKMDLELLNFAFCFVLEKV